MRHSSHIRFFVSILALLIIPASALAQTISVSITNTSGPSGTLEEPRFVIDSDIANPDPAYNRHTINGAVTANFQRSGSGSVSGTYRLIAELLDSDGAVVPLANADLGLGTKVSDSFEISFSGFIALPINEIRIFNLLPAGDLGVGESYRIRYRVQELVTVGGQNTWTNSTPFSSIQPFTLIHFRDHPATPNARYLRGYLMAEPAWVKVDALQTSPTTAGQSFQAAVPYRIWRYDINGNAVAVLLRFTAELRDDLGNIIPLENDGVSTQLIIPNPLVAGNPDRPSLTSSNRIFNFSPSTQLDVRNRTYRVRVTFEHREISNPETFINNGTSGDSAPERLFHFNGNLLIGSGDNQLQAQFFAYNSLDSGAAGPGYVNTSANITDGAFPDFPDYTFGDGSTVIMRLLANGNAEASFIQQPVQVADGGEVEALINGIRVIYPSTTLTTAGAVASATRVRLPQGLSFTDSRTSTGNRFQPDFVVPGQIQLNGQFQHTGNLTEQTSSDAWIFDEARTLFYRTSQFHMTSEGEIRFTTPEAEWVHAQFWEMLENESAEFHESPEMALRKSNEGYLRHANVAASPTTTIFNAAPDGTARCQQADLLLHPTTFTTHFPAGVEIESTDVGQLLIRDGLVSQESHLSGVSPFTLSYDRSCENDACAPPANLATAHLEMTLPTGQLHLTPDGGVHGEVVLPASELRWGLRNDGTAAHRSDEFANATFLAPGNQLYQSENPASSSPVLATSAPTLAPAVLTLAGFDADGTARPLYFGSTGYRDGAGSWPGATFTVDLPGRFGASRLADMAEELPYALFEEVTKYYVRPSGIAGRHVAAPDVRPFEVELYGYPFALGNFQLTFISNQNHASRLNGSLSVPFPSNFQLDFTELRLTCTGQLDRAELDPSDIAPKPLAYWNGVINPLAINFVPLDESECASPRALTLGVIGGAANIDAALAGTLAFLPTGNIATSADEVPGADGRLGLPAAIPLNGPGEEIYTLNPVSKLYFNNPEAPGAPPEGFVSFAATCNVPYFEALKLHVMTSARAGSLAPVFLAGGWEENDDTFFTNTTFDAHHRGFPADFPAIEYQQPQEINDYTVFANQTLLRFFTLEYPLRWNPNARFFQSWEPSETLLLLAEIEHQVEYLSPANAEISFGAQFRGLPRVNLVSIGHNIVDEGLGAARAFTDAAQSAVADALITGVDDIGNLVADNLDRLLDGVLDGLEVLVIDPLYMAILASYENAVAANQSYQQWLNDGTSGLLAVLDEFFTASGADPDTLFGFLNLLADPSAGDASLITRIDDALLQGILAIDAVVGEINTFQGEILDPDNTDGIDPSDITINPGILALFDSGDGSMERRIVRDLIVNLIRDLADPEVADALLPLFDDASSELNAQLSEFLVRFSPVFERVADTLLQAREYLVTLRSQLETGGGLLNTLQQVLSAAQDRIISIVGVVRSVVHFAILTTIETLSKPLDAPLALIGGFLDDFDKDQFVARIRAEVRDRLSASEFIGNIQYVLRNFISEFDIHLRSFIDSAFAVVNTICKAIVSKSLGPIDNRINTVIGALEEALSIGSITGYAHIQDDSLRRLRLDAIVEFQLAEKFRFNGFLEILQYESATSTGTEGANPCIIEGESLLEVRLGAVDTGIEWSHGEIRADIAAWFALALEPEIRPRGLGGSVTMTAGHAQLQSFGIGSLSAIVSLSPVENYIAGAARLDISGIEAQGGLFYGLACSPEPVLAVDPNAASIVGQGPVFGSYIYGETYLPISEALLDIPATCFFRISASASAAGFINAVGPVFAGKMRLQASGEALCVVSISGEVNMAGRLSNGTAEFSGSGLIAGKAGICPVCTEFNANVGISYQNGSWSIDLP